MRILMLLSKSFREDARVRKEAIALREAGHEVLVVEWARHGPGAPADETVHGFPVLRHHDRGLGRLLPGVALRNPGWWRGAVRLGLRLHAVAPIDVVHAHDLDTLPAGVRLKRRTGARLVFDAHEIFSRMVRAERGWMVATVAARMEARLLPHVDHVVTVNEALAEHYAATRAPVTVVMNAPERVETPPPWPPPPFTVVYVGLLHPSRFFPQAVHTLGGMTGVRFLVAGKREGNWEEVAAAASRYPDVTFLGAVPSDKVLATLGQGHVVLCMLDPTDPQYQVATATKVLDAMALERPVITTAGTYTGRLVQDAGCGLVVPYSEAGLRQAVADLMSDGSAARGMARKGRERALADGNWEAQARRLVDLYGTWETKA